ncbi:MAG: metal ABC transporter ATP-binding protein, partial [bacterium]|nr:metal ABC transporter ATP-binding protein [bacterium]
KSTLVKIILSILKPFSGSSTIFGEESSRPGARSHIGYVPQHIAQSAARFPATVQEIVGMGAKSKKAIEIALDIAGISSFKNRRIGDLSGGERQRVFIARALALEPDILILDEPTAGVDAESQERFYSFVRDLNKTHGKTILFVSHDIDVVAKETSSVLSLNRRVVFSGPSKEFLETLSLHHHHA